MSTYIDHPNTFSQINEMGKCCVLVFPPSAIHSKNLVAIVHLLVTLAMHFMAPIRLPEHVSVNVVVVKVCKFICNMDILIPFISYEMNSKGLNFFIFYRKRRAPYTHHV